MQILLDGKVSQRGTCTPISGSKRKPTGRRAVLQFPFSALLETPTEISQTEGSVVETPSTSCSGLWERNNGLCPFIKLKGTLKVR